ncbi:MAG: hypothetical protein O3C40_19245 [Planctomycetota bacterium]|nr:hypothetical protein [Planctomycetota bacterium]
MKRFLLEITDELDAAIAAAVGDKSRNAAIEDWLWRIGDVKQAAKAKSIERTQRLGRGRPKKSE